MRISHAKITTPLARSLVAAATPLPRRAFHASATLAMPRRRNFFSSNQLLSNEDRIDGAGVAGSHGERLSRSEGHGVSHLTSLTTSKRKNVRVSPTKKLASKAKKNKPVSHPSPTERVVNDDHIDYRTRIQAICAAESFDMDQVQELLRYHAFDLDPDSAEFDTDAVVHARNVNNGDIFVFPSGTVVGWSVPAETLIKIATKHLLPAANEPHIDKLEIEELEFVVDESREISQMRGEVVVLGTRGEDTEGGKLNTTITKIAFSSGLARSPKLAVLENIMEDYITSTQDMSKLLAGGKSGRISRSLVLRKTGELINLRGQLNHYSELTDSLPDMFWDSEQKLEKYYELVGSVLDVRSRINSLNRKIDYAHEEATVLREMTSEKHSTRLEWIIIILIAVEVAFELESRFYRGQARLAAQKELDGAIDG